MLDICIFQYQPPISMSNLQAMELDINLVVVVILWMYDADIPVFNLYCRFELLNNRIDSISGKPKAFSLGFLGHIVT